MYRCREGFGIQCETRLCNQNSNHTFTKVRMRHANHRALQHTFLFIKQQLDLVMDPSPLVPGTLAGLELFIYWEKRPLCRSKQSLVSRSHSAYGPAAEKTITGDSFLRCGPLTSRRLAQPLRGHGIRIPRTWECPAYIASTTRGPTAQAPSATNQ